MNNIKLSIPEEFFKEEIRCGYKVTGKLKKIWAIQLDLLYEFDRVCKKYDLKYYAFAGTLLGAIRHAGFIPWDNDIDIMMDRRNYDKLQEIAGKEFIEPYFFQTEHTDHGTRRGHAQLRNSKTTAILESERMCNLKFNQGIFIDIFQYDNIPDNKKERNKYLRKTRILKDYSERIGTITDRYIKERGKKGAVRTILHIFANPLFHLFGNKNIAYVYLEKLMTKYINQDTKDYAPLMLRSDRYIYSKEMVGKGKEVPFEMITIPVPDDSEKILDITFGDWKKYVIGATVHGGIYFNPDKEYEYFVNEGGGNS